MDAAKDLVTRVIGWGQKTVLGRQYHEVHGEYKDEWLTQRISGAMVHGATTWQQQKSIDKNPSVWHQMKCMRNHIGTNFIVEELQKPEKEADTQVGDGQVAAVDAEIIVRVEAAWGKGRLGEFQAATAGVFILWFGGVRFAHLKRSYAASMSDLFVHWCV